MWSDGDCIAFVSGKRYGAQIAVEDQSIGALFG
jgi:hypothetical protein